MLSRIETPGPNGLASAVALPDVTKVRLSVQIGLVLSP